MRTVKLVMLSPITVSIHVHVCIYICQYQMKLRLTLPISHCTTSLSDRILFQCRGNSFSVPISTHTSDWALHLMRKHDKCKYDALNQPMLCVRDW